MVIKKKKEKNLFFCKQQNVISSNNHKVISYVLLTLLSLLRLWKIIYSCKALPFDVPHFLNSNPLRQLNRLNIVVFHLFLFNHKTIEF